MTKVTYYAEYDKNRNIRYIKENLIDGWNKVKIEIEEWEYLWATQK